MHATSKLLLSSALSAQAHAIWLDEKVMTLSLKAAKLSDVSFSTHKEPNRSLYRITLDDTHYYVSQDSSDMAIITKVDNKVCNNDKGCCNARQGFFCAYEAPFNDQFEADLVECAASCNDPDECVTLIGHSQGGAIANLAAIISVDLNPYVITFGQLAAVHEPCLYINSEKYYCYINSVMDGNELEHDVVPFSLGWDPSGAVANYGLIVYPNISNFHLNIEPFQTHSMDGGEESFG
eukprot:15365494-Ditylum_brightwellii.AAC.1